MPFDGIERLPWIPTLLPKLVMGKKRESTDDAANKEKENNNTDSK